VTSGWHDLSRMGFDSSGGSTIFLVARAMVPL
jgi:hypothetical protein